MQALTTAHRSRRGYFRKVGWIVESTGHLSRLNAILWGQASISKVVPTEPENSTYKRLPAFAAELIDLRADVAGGQLGQFEVDGSITSRREYASRGAGFVYARHTRATHSMTICSELRAGISRLSIAAHPNRTRVERIPVEWRASVQGAGCINRLIWRKINRK